MTARFLAAALTLALTACAPTQPPPSTRPPSTLPLVPDDPSERDLFADAAVILDYKAGMVAKWTSAPSLVLVTDDPAAEAALARVAALIEADTGLTLRDGLREGEGPVRVVDARGIAFDAPRFETTGAKASSAQPLYRFRPDAEEPWLRAHVFLFFLAQEPAARVNRVSPRGAGHRSFQQGRAPCYFHIHTERDRGRPRAAFIFANRDEPRYDLLECLYEELAQAMGLYHDADGTPHFTFDDTTRPFMTFRANDACLLRALYDPSIAPADPVEDAVALFRAQVEAGTCG